MMTNLEDLRLVASRALAVMKLLDGLPAPRQAEILAIVQTMVAINMRRSQEPQEIRDE